MSINDNLYIYNTLHNILNIQHLCVPQRTLRDGVSCIVKYFRIAFFIISKNIKKKIISDFPFDCQEKMYFEKLSIRRKSMAEF